MKLEFKDEKDFTAAKLSKFEDCLTRKNAVVLIHAEWCGHCHALRPEFTAFKSKTKHHVFEIESNALGHLEKYPKIFKRITPKDGSLYFPMIVLFIKRRDGKRSQKKIHGGERTQDALEKAFKNKRDKVKHGGSN